MLKTKELQVISYKRKVQQAYVLGLYSALFDLKKKPLFAVDSQGAFLSAKTRQKHGTVYIPYETLKNYEGDFFYIISGKKHEYKKYRVDLLKVTEFFIEYNIVTVADKKKEVQK